ncbi:MAG: CDP-diacylglycerol--glycerol-3-phosphate 3-phosphatidyltransferase [Planctomycetota bacterium]|nr:CDP-diacylglycerol--glycerol-3-phosphate 3-phosphatidyltransferase [Planctomycetota bacterium]
MNIPNTITVGRLVLAVGFFGLLTWYLQTQGAVSNGGGGPDQGAWILDIALGVFVAAAVSDWLDGYIARRLDMTTTFGRIADPMADKIVVCGAFAYFLPIGDRTFVMPWMVVLILTREFVITGLRAYAESQGRAYGALYLGKLKMWVQCMTIGTVLVYLGHFEGERWAEIVTQGAVYVTVGMTVGSAIPYLRQGTKV